MSRQAERMADSEADIPEAIRQAVEDYLRGAWHCDRARLERAFHPEAHIAGFIDGNYADEAAPDFIARLMGSPSEESRGEPYDKQILGARWTEDTACAFVRTRVHDWLFTDYLLLMKIGGRWVIRNKIYTNASGDGA